MRLLIRTTNNNKIIPFDYQGMLIGTLHKWLGYNDIHDKISLYSFSWLKGTTMSSEGFNCNGGSNWFVSFHESQYIKSIVKSIMYSPEMFCGLTVTDVIIKEDPNFSEVSNFNLASPILLKQKINNGTVMHYTFNDNNVNNLLEDTIRHKMKIANIPEDITLKISIDKSSLDCKTKLVKIHNIENKCFYSPIHIEGQEITKRFIWNVGLGNSTGSGFGSIY